MIMAFLTLLGGAGAYTALPYLEGEASADSVMDFHHDGQANQTLLPVSDRAADEGPDTQRETEAARPETEGEPQKSPIDWAGLREMNPDVVGWLSVAKTRIDYPLVQAQPHDPQHYLHHDITHTPSPYGCPYLDADALDQGGLAAPFVVVYGHHLINGQMFSDFAKFADESYARKHASMILETPAGPMRLKAIAVNVVDANEELIQTRFSDEDELTDYFRTCIAESEVVLDRVENAIYHQVFCFVTCSYGSENERTLVYAIHEDEE